VEKLDGKSQLETPRRRCEDDIKIDLLEMVWEGMDRSDVPQDRDRWRALVNVGSMKCGEFLD
jgi:hypothetical protein